MVEKMNTHYSFTHPASIHDEEALTVLELAGRQGAKINEVIDEVNTIPDKIDTNVQKYIKNGSFDDAIDKHTATLMKELADCEEYVEQQNTQLNRRIDGYQNTLASEVNTLEARVDNLVAPSGSTTTLDAEVIDARVGLNGTAYTSLGGALREGGTFQAIKIGKASAYSWYGHVIRFKGVGSTGGVSIKFNSGITVKCYSETHDIYWDRQTELGTNLTKDDAGCYIVTIPKSHSVLVFNLASKQCFIRDTQGNVRWNDIILFEASSGYVMSGALMHEYNRYLTMVENFKDGFYVCEHAEIGGYKRNTDLSITVTIGSTLGHHKFTTTWVDWNDIVTDELVQYITIEGYKAHITIPKYTQLVYDFYSEKLLMYNYYGGANTGGKQLPQGYISLLVNASACLCGGCLYPSFVNTNVSDLSKKMTATTFDYPTDAVNRFMENFNNSGEKFDSFLFFTDPHLTKGATNYTDYMGAIKEVYDTVTLSTVIAGGDWLNDSDTQTEALVKLASVNGMMRKNFADFISVIGNHDTNYQGKLSDTDENWTGRVTNETIKNVFYPDKEHAYFIHDTANTRFVCFDTGTENETISTYQNNQLKWFCEMLNNNMRENLAITLHIVTPVNETDLQPITSKILEIAGMFNARGSITIDGNTYNFAGGYGKVRFCLGGHFHKDLNYTINGIPVITTTNLQDTGTPSYDLVTADYSNNTLKLVRVGTGSDRSFII